MERGVQFSRETATSPVDATPTQTSGAVSSAALQLRIKDQLEDVFDRAARSNVTVYTVDPCGLRLPPPPPSPQGPRPTCVPGLEIDYLVGVASATGGRPVVNSTDFEPGLSAVFQ